MSKCVKQPGGLTVSPHLCPSAQQGDSGGADRGGISRVTGSESARNWPCPARRGQIFGLAPAGILRFITVYKRIVLLVHSWSVSALDSSDTAFQRCAVALVSESIARASRY